MHHAPTSVKHKGPTHASVRGRRKSWSFVTSISNWLISGDALGLGLVEQDRRLIMVVMRSLRRVPGGAGCFVQSTSPVLSLSRACSLTGSQ
jgi:hypothetical protein